MKTYVKNGYEKRVRWITVSQRGESGRQCGKLGQKAQWHRCQWQRRQQCHSALHRLRSTAQLSVRTWSCSLHISSHSLDLLHSLLLSLPPVCLLPLLPPQRRAAAGAQQEDHGKPVRLRQQREWGHLRRPLPPHMHGTSRKRGRNIKTRCIGSTSNLLNRKDWSSIKQDRNQSSFMTHSQLIVSRKLLWWNLEKLFTRKYMRHLDHLQRFFLKIIGWKTWIQKLLEVVKTPNKWNQNQKPNYQEWRGLWVDNQPVCSDSARK